MTTTDLVRVGHPSFQTVYNYLPAQAVSSFDNPYLDVGSAFGGDTIVYNDTSGKIIRTEKKVWTNALGDAQLAAVTRDITSMEI